MRAIPLVFATLLMAATLVPLAGQEVAGVRLATMAEVGQQQLTLRGAHLLRWKWLVKIYVAALYLPAPVTSDQVLGEVPRRIMFHYRRGFTAEQLVEATNATITRGLDAAATAAIAPQLAAFNALYRPVQEGDVMAIDYLPGTGTTMRLNDTVLGTVEGSSFAQALFAIWLGEQAVDAGLKQALLGEG